MAGENRQEKKRVAAVYAKAIYDLGVEHGDIGTVLEELKLMGELLRQIPELEKVFDSVAISMDARSKVLQNVCGEFHPVIRSFFDILNRRNRLGLLPEVIRALLNEDDKRNHRMKVKLFTATSVDKQMMDQIVQILRAYLLAEPMITHQIQTDLIGGFVAQAGDFLIDGSIKSRLSSLQKQLLMRGEDEIQSRRDFIGYKA
jgi:F-type H+-transporting ATPase subunit delta